METLSEYFARRAIAQAMLPDGGSIALRFTSAIAEHLATRRGAGLFDFSFMGGWEFRGRQARACLARLQTRDLEALAPGRLCYTLLCRDDGSVFIDATVWRFDADRYWLFTGRRTDIGHLGHCASSFDVDIVPLHHRSAVIAVQGPASAELVEHALPGSDVASIRYFAFRRYATDDCDAWIARLGYSGEIGYEIIVPAERAVFLWMRLLQAPFDRERLECGMEAANSLRIEAGFIHFAHELRERVSPSELGLSRLVRTGRKDFIGGAALERVAPATQRMMGVRLSGVIANDDAGYAESPRVHLTSEAYSPTFQCELGIAFVDAASGRDADVTIDDGRTGVLAELPFYARSLADPRGSSG